MTRSLGDRDPTRARQSASEYARVASEWLEAALREELDPAPAALGEVASARQRYDEHVAAHRDAPFERLSTSLRLSQFEHDLLLLCWLLERCPETFAPLLQALQSAAGGGGAYVTFALAFRLFGENNRAAMLPDGPLRRFRLVEIVQAPDQGLSTASLRADEHIAAFADGELTLNDGPRLDAMLMRYVRPLPPADVEWLPASHRRFVDELAEQWRADADGYPLQTLVGLGGVDASGKREIVSAASAAAMRSPFVAAARQLPTHPADIDTFTALWNRDSLLFPNTLFIDDEHDEPAGGDPGARRTALERLIGQLQEFGPIVLATREPRTWEESAAAANHTVDKPTRSEQQRLWSSRLRPAFGADEAAADHAADLLAWQFNFDARTIASVADGHAKSTPATSGETAEQALWGACRRAAQPVLDGLARRVDARALLDDIVLPAPQVELLRKIAAQVRARSRVYHQWGFGEKSTRGLGIAVLFAGESGTGKTMAAEVLANMLELDLYRIDLSTVVSKYIGETERNLRRLFDAAEDGGAILFFDEADALFGKRSEVKDSHDRYSNIEINYLLQRMESYHGLAILATNMKSALDHAFLRRLRFTVEFPSPSATDRRTIWSKVFPQAMLQDLGGCDLDLNRLCKLKLVGGNIHSIALNAAFLAADRGCPLNDELIMEVARDEFVKLGRHIAEEDFAVTPRQNKPAVRATAPTGAE